MAKKVKVEKPKRTGPMIVVLLTSKRNFGDVRVLSWTGKTTVHPWAAREFETTEEAKEAIEKRLYPRGYRARIDVIPRVDRKKRLGPERVRTEFGVIRRLPGQEIFFPPCPEPASLPSARSR